MFIFKKNYIYKLLTLFIIFLFFLILSNNINAASSDAVAVRVMSNNKHYSPLKWYKNKKFVGAPQSLTVDGYQAIRDGRTVYVNASNILGNSIYTNIYLLSYSQKPDKNTIDIYGRILANWQFNVNLMDAANIGKCIISTKHCNEDKDCSKEQTCSEEKFCQYIKEISCYNDNECATGFFCSSAKAKATRDTKRLSDIEDINSMMKVVKYPDLRAGSYLQGKSVSAWPSWNDALSKQLKNNLPKDPINKLVNNNISCDQTPKYDKITCWDNYQKLFINGPSNTLTTPIQLNTGSLAYTYYYIPAVGNTPANYNLCAKIEGSYGNLGNNICVDRTN